MEMSPRRNKEDRSMRVHNSSIMAFYRTSRPRPPFILTFFILVFRYSSSSVLHCYSLFFWCVLPATMPTTFAASVGHYTCHLTYSYPSMQMQLLLPHNILFLDLPKDGSSNYPRNVDNCLPNYMVSHPRRLQSSVLDYILNKYLL